MMVAPAWRASCATCAFVVSIEIGAVVLVRRVLMMGIVRASSSCVVIFGALGAVD